MSRTVNTDNPTQADIKQLLNDVHGEGVDSTRSLNQLHTIAENHPELIDTKVIAEHIQSSNRARVRKRLYGIAHVLVRANPDSAPALFGVIQDDLTYPDIDDGISQDELQTMRGYIFNILYSATSAGIEVPPRVLEELYAGVVEYPVMTSAERTVDILGSLIANDSDVADQVTEILIELSAIPEDDEVSRRFRKYATAGLAGLLDEDELPDSADIDQIERSLERNRSLLEDSQQSDRSSDSSSRGLIDRLLGVGRNEGDRRDD